MSFQLSDTNSTTFISSLPAKLITYPKLPQSHEHPLLNFSKPLTNKHSNNIESTSNNEEQNS